MSYLSMEKIKRLQAENELLAKKIDKVEKDLKEFKKLHCKKK